ncbi:MAG: cytochrome c peroxidase [Chloroflexota bacterium]
MANRGSGTVSVIDLIEKETVDTLYVGRQPYGVLADAAHNQIYISIQGDDRVIVIDAANHAQVDVFETADRPSGLALSLDGSHLYVTHLFLNHISVLNVGPQRLYLPAILLDAHPGFKSDQAELMGQQILHRSTIDLWTTSNLVQSIILGPNGNTAFVPHTRSISSNEALTFDSTVFPTVSEIDLIQETQINTQTLRLEDLDPPAVGLPYDGALSPDHSQLWIVNAASNDLSVIDLNANTLAAHIEVGDKPTGILFSPDGSEAYVNNTLAGTISVINTSELTITQVISTTTIPLEPQLLLGKRLFNSSDDPRMGIDQWMSCNTCHFDGEHDGQTWLLGFAGPRNTSSLLGVAETPPFRWSGEWDELADLEFTIREDAFGHGLIDGELNCAIFPPDCTNFPPNAGRSADLDALSAYVATLAILPPSSPDGLTPAVLRGQALFESEATGCASCHPAPLYTDNLIHDVDSATADEKVGPAFNTPSLRDIVNTPPYFHHGDVYNLSDTFMLEDGSVHDLSDRLTRSEVDDLAAFLAAIPLADGRK